VSKTIWMRRQARRYEPSCPRPSLQEPPTLAGGCSPWIEVPRLGVGPPSLSRDLRVRIARVWPVAPDPRAGAGRIARDSRPVFKFVQGFSSLVEQQGHGQHWPHEDAEDRRRGRRPREGAGRYA